MKIEVILKPCPWCKKTPELNLPIDREVGDQTTWRWVICCKNEICTMNPISPHTNIRKNQKKNSGMIRFKMDQLAKSWNFGNDCVAYEKKVVDLEEIGL